MYTLIAAPRISKETFHQILSDNNSPVAEVADECYDICVHFQIDPAVALAFFQQDSDFGTRGAMIEGRSTLDNKNWGNRFGDGGGVGGMQQFDTWQDGLEYWCKYYYDEHAWDGRLTVENVVPRYTNGNAVQYTAAVNAAIAGWQDQPEEPVISTYFSSPNRWQGRGGNPINALVLHATAGPFTPSLHWLMNPNAQVSAHYLISKEGIIFQLVDETDRAWHAGKSYWKGWTSLNHNSIGIELVNQNDGLDPYPEEQVARCCWLARQIVRRYDIEREMLTTHYLISPGRKTDPRGFPLEAFRDSVYLASVDLKEELTRATFEAMNIPYNPGAAFVRKAAELGLGAPLSSEQEIEVGGQTYVYQIFACDTLYTVRGDWSNIKRLSEY